jgi:hypothetical protein
MTITSPNSSTSMAVTPSDIPSFLIFLDRKGLMPFQASHGEILICKPFSKTDKDEWERRPIGSQTVNE